MKILCYGATGVQGAPVAAQLKQRGHNVRVIVRDTSTADSFRAKGIEVVSGDLLDSRSLQEASEGVDAVFLMLPLVYDEELIMPYFQNVLYAAQQAQVKLLVFNTSTRVPEMATNVWAFELKRKMQQRLMDSGLPFIVLRPTFYMENLLGPWTMNPIIERQVVSYTLEHDRKASWISAWDMAQFCVSALERPELAGSFIDVGGAETLDGHDIAAQISKISGQALSYEQASIDDFENQLKEFVGPRAAFEVRALNQWWRDHKDYDPGFVVDIEKVKRILPIEKLSTFAEWASTQQWK